MPIHLSQRDRAKVKRSRQLWRRVHDELRHATGWRALRGEWTFAGEILPGGIGIRAVLVGTESRNGFVILSHIEIQSHSREDRTYVDEVRVILKARGYEQFSRYRADETTFLSKSIVPAEFTNERRWLVAFLGGTDDPVRSSPRTMAAFSASFDARRAGPWLPYRGAWQRLEPIEIAGRKMEAGLMFHLAPRDLRGFSLGLATSIAIWPSWNGRGPIPKWLEARRALLARQFRTAGHRAEWHRGPKGRGVGVMSLVWPRPPLDLRQIRTVLDSAEFGDV